MKKEIDLGFFIKLTQSMLNASSSENLVRLQLDHLFKEWGEDFSDDFINEIIDLAKMKNAFENENNKKEKKEKVTKDKKRKNLYTQESEDELNKKDTFLDELTHKLSTLKAAKSVLDAEIKRFQEEIEKFKEIKKSGMLDDPLNNIPKVIKDLEKRLKELEQQREGVVEEIEKTKKRIKQRDNDNGFEK